MILLIDNYDSFTYNLVQILEQLDHEGQVFRDDCIDARCIAGLQPAATVISPGPGTPASTIVFFPVEGVQFHPESILTESGAKILQNFSINGGRHHD